MNPTAPTPPRPQHPDPAFKCSICEEASSRICSWCTNDACDNHICAECLRCSDCCECQMERRKQ